MDGEAMELKDMILSTLAELEDVAKKEEEVIRPNINKKIGATFAVQEESYVVVEETPLEVEKVPLEVEEENENLLEPQKQFYLSLRERILVLFEGFQSPNNKNIEAKIDLTLNFLEYLLATIDEQLESMDNPKK